MSIPVCIVGPNTPGATPITVSSRSDATEVTLVGLNFSGVNLVYIAPQSTPGSIAVRFVGAPRLVDGTFTTTPTPPPVGSGTAIVLEGTLTAIVLEGTLTALVTE